MSEAYQALKKARLDSEAPYPDSCTQAGDLAGSPAPSDVVEGLIPEGITIISGESGASKTFVELSMAGAASNGLPWMGRQTRRGTWVYVPFEVSALSLRVQALQEQYDLDDLHILKPCGPLSPRVERDGSELSSIGEATLTADLIALGKWCVVEERPPIVGVAFDTLRDSLSGSEDSSENVAAYGRALRRILATTGVRAAVVLHHTGWQDGRESKHRERGSSALRGLAEASLYIEGKDNGDGTAALTLTVRKMRDGEAGRPIHMIRRRVNLPGFDAFGLPLASCVIEADTRTKQDLEDAERTASKVQDDELDLLVLQTIGTCRATRQEQLRVRVKRSMPAVRESVARLTLEGLAVEGHKRGEPYALTAAGRDLLGEGDRTRPKETERDPSLAAKPSDERDRRLSPVGESPIGLGGSVRNLPPVLEGDRI